MKVGVLGATGMLGSMVLDVLDESGDFELTATLRGDRPLAWSSRVTSIPLEAVGPSPAGLARALEGCAWAINCIGVIKHHMDNRVPETIERAIQVNALFPHALAKAAAAVGCSVLQIATDCVYSGDRGAYRETDPHDALDAYGKSKSLGEVRAPMMHHLRCSIIGPEQGTDRRSLLEWFLKHPDGAKVAGYTNHLWNGVTTLHFARICQGILRENSTLPHLAHVVPADVLSKGALLHEFRKAFRREDLEIDPVPASQAVDRSLATVDDELNRGLWAAAGYGAPPTLPHMVEELAAWIFDRKGASR